MDSKKRSIRIDEDRFQPRDMAQRSHESQKVARTRAALRHAADQALEIGDRGKLPADLGALCRPGNQGRYDRLPPVQLVQIANRLIDHPAQRAGAHGRARLIQHAEETAAGAAASDGACELRIRRVAASIPTAVPVVSVFSPRRSGNSDGFVRAR